MPDSGSNDHDETEPELSHRLHRLAERILQGAAIPVAGAGISSQGRSSWCEEFRPSVRYLQQRLADRLQKEVDSICDEEEVAIAKARLNDLAGLLNLREGTDRADLKKLIGRLLKARGVDSKEMSPHKDLRVREELVAFVGGITQRRDKVDFDRLCEIIRWLIGYRGLVDTLRIRCFDGLSTSAAHRYLARLAREGLILEMITTNYDSCLEEAFSNTFLDHERPPADILDAVAIRTLDEYRRHAATREDSQGRPVPHIFKINGCATRLRTQTEGNKTPSIKDKEDLAREIILTERQLQDFRGEQWKQDFLQDRTRSRSLVLTGFGADEPQVRRTILNLVTEFARTNDCKKTANEEKGIWEKRGAPFVCAYDEWLTFPQLQLLLAFRETHRQVGDGPLRDLKLAEINAFTGQDSEKLGGEGTKLTADLLWKRVFQLTINHLLERHTQRGTAFFRWLKDAGLAPESRRRDLLEWLFPERNQKTPKFWTKFGWLWHELDPGPEEAIMLRLCQWLLSIQGQEMPGKAERWKNDYYLPLREDSLLILATLCVLQHLVPGLAPPAPKDTKATDQVSLHSAAQGEPHRLGLRLFYGKPGGNDGELIVSPEDQNSAEKEVDRKARRVLLQGPGLFLVSERWEERQGGEAPHTSGRLVRQIVLPTLQIGPDRSVIQSFNTAASADQAGGKTVAANQAQRTVKVFRVARVAADQVLGTRVSHLSRLFAETQLPRTRARLIPL